MDPRTQLLDLVADPDSAYDQPAGDLAPARLQAADELFQERRLQIPLLAKRAEEAGIDRIEDFGDLVPLLFAHTVYKSYPQSFYDKGRWDRMLQWLNTLSVEDVTDVDVDGVADVDDVARASVGRRARGHRDERVERQVLVPQPHHARPRHEDPPLQVLVRLAVRPGGRRPRVLLAGPVRRADQRGRGVRRQRRELGPSRRGLRPLRRAAADLRDQRAGRLPDPDGRTGRRRRTRSPTVERRAQAKAERMQVDLAKFTEKILEYRDRPIFLSGMWGQHMMIIERARELGVGDGEFHPESVIGAGGGVKGVALPPDYKEQVDRFYGDVVRPAVLRHDRAGAAAAALRGRALPRCAGPGHAAAGRERRAPADRSGRDGRPGRRLASGSWTSPTRAAGAD